MGCGWIVSAQGVDGLASEEGGLAENGDYKGLHSFLRCSKLRKVTFLSARLSAFIILSQTTLRVSAVVTLASQMRRPGSGR